MFTATEPERDFHLKPNGVEESPDSSDRIAPLTRLSESMLHILCTFPKTLLQLKRMIDANSRDTLNSRLRDFLMACDGRKPLS